MIEELELVEKTSEFAEETDNTGMIYCIVNTENDKRYYGQTGSYRTKHGKRIKFSVRMRFLEHINNATKNRDTTKLHKAILEYGP